MDYFKKLKKHWLISTIILCGVVFGTIWTLSVNPTVAPRNFEIEKSGTENTQREGEVEKLVSQPSSTVSTDEKLDNEEKSLMEGTSFTSKFGFMVYISGSDNNLKHANIYITLKNQKDKNHKNVGIGEKIKVSHENNNYSITINDIRGGWVDLTIRKNA